MHPHGIDPFLEGCVFPYLAFADLAVDHPLLMKQELKERFDGNLARVKNLADIYENKLVETRPTGGGQGRRPVNSTDILRASVVFLHATLEEFIRGILEWRLPEQGDGVLNSVPLVGTGDRPERFLLGKLAAHKSKTVAEVIKESVKASLTRSNYNSTTEIVSALESVGIAKGPYEAYLPKLNAMIERRHQVVHRADRNPQHGRGHHEAVSIGLHDINEWIEAIQSFFDEVHGQLPNN